MNALRLVNLSVFLLSGKKNTLRRANSSLFTFHFSLLTFHFSLLTFHFSLLTFHFSLKTFAITQSVWRSVSSQKSSVPQIW
jgi:hypothetical protein